MAPEHVESGQQTASVRPNSTSTSASAPRKRRKRAPAPGAGADCFTCVTRNETCDRRRPYCSQCLNDGKDCAGYKTQLTWGNGVASRGKLRGLSLPIAGTQKLAATSNSPPKPKKRPSPLDSQPQLSEATTEPAGPIPYMLSPISATANGGVGFGLEQHRQASTIPISYSTTTTASWPPAPVPVSIALDQGSASYPGGPSTTLASPLDGFTFEDGLRPDLAYSSGEIMSPMPYTASSPDSAYLGRVMSNASTAASATVSAYPGSPPLPSPYDGTFSEPSQFPFYPRPEESYIPNGHYLQPLPVSHADEEVIDEAGDDMSHRAYDDECAVIEDSTSVGFPQTNFRPYSLPLSPFSAVSAIGATPRMQYLIKYYAEVISPVIVAFDGPSNPYRTQILRLAASSDTLQHAISALAASNLRQRRETGALSTGKTLPARRSSMAHVNLTTEQWHGTARLSPQDQAREETLHKGIAIQSLNRQLANPALRKGDSILATLLILCLFHICDSGIAKFQTQFAGVKKLLSLRGNDLGLSTGDSKWFIRMFTWFDAMTATVNDREGQLRGYHLDVSALPDEEWALENLAGCDGQLFKTIAQLGRLNVLSQGRSVEESPVIVSRPVPPMPRTANLDYSEFDGNGWMRMADDDDLFTTKTTGHAVGADTTTQFWREWREIRQVLQTWRLDTTIFDSSSRLAPDLNLEERIDLANISESFRYSALLYTERLANPDVPSTDSCIRTWVDKSLMFIKAVKSDVYLLWPLFITGSECVDEVDRGTIRQRCLDIQKDSGFLNNKSCLDLLEKVWRRADEKSRKSRKGSLATVDPDIGFRFTTIMKLENHEGEYIVV